MINRLYFFIFSWSLIIDRDPHIKSRVQVKPSHLLCSARANISIGCRLCNTDFSEGFETKYDLHYTQGHGEVKKKEFIHFDWKRHGLSRRLAAVWYRERIVKKSCIRRSLTFSTLANSFMFHPASWIISRTVACIQLDGVFAAGTDHPCLGEWNDVLVVL